MAVAKMQMWMKHRKSGFYVRYQIAEKERIAKERYCRSKLSQAVCQASWQQCYDTNFDKNNFACIRKLPTAGNKQCTVETQISVQREERGAQMVDVLTCSPPTILIDDITYPVHQDTLDLIPDDSVYSLSHVNTRHILCIANKKNRWQRWASAAKQSISRTIKWRISPHCCEHKHKCKRQRGLSQEL